MLISFADRISRGCDRRPVDLCLSSDREDSPWMFSLPFNDPQLSPSLTATYFALPIYTDKSFGFAGTLVRFMRRLSERFRGKTRGWRGRHTDAKQALRQWFLTKRPITSNI